jgi:hypothetical protein
MAELAELAGLGRCGELDRAWPAVVRLGGAWRVGGWWDGCASHEGLRVLSPCGLHICVDQLKLGHALHLQTERGLLQVGGGRQATRDKATGEPVCGEVRRPPLISAR